MHLYDVQDRLPTSFFTSSLLAFGLEDLSAIRFCKQGGLSLTDEVTLHTLDLKGSRLVCLQGHLHECFFGSDSKRPVAMIPESCRPKEATYFEPGRHVMRYRDCS